MYTSIEAIRHPKNSNLTPTDASCHSFTSRRHSAQSAPELPHTDVLKDLVLVAKPRVVPNNDVVRTMPAGATAAQCRSVILLCDLVTLRPFSLGLGPLETS